MQPPDDLRASDSDRERVAARLHAAAAEGRLSIGELDERLGSLYQARTYGELVPLTRDLPESAPPPAAPAAAGESGPSVSFGVLAGSERNGEWVVPAVHTAVGFLGAVDLDLTTARFVAPEVVIRCVGVLGAVQVTVPHDADVVVGGFALMGAFGRNGGGRRRGGSRVRVTGFAFWGGVDVKRADPPAARKGLTEGG